MTPISERILELEEQINDPASARCWEAIRVFGLLAEHHFQRAVALPEADGHGKATAAATISLLGRLWARTRCRDAQGSSTESIRPLPEHAGTQRLLVASFSKPRRCL